MYDAILCMMQYCAWCRSPPQPLTNTVEVEDKNTIDKEDKNNTATRTEDRTSIGLTLTARKRKFEPETTFTFTSDKDKKRHARAEGQASRIDLDKKRRTELKDSKASQGVLIKSNLFSNMHCYSNRGEPARDTGPRPACLPGGGGDLGQGQDKSSSQGGPDTDIVATQRIREGQSASKSENVRDAVIGQSAGTGTVIAYHRPANKQLGLLPRGKK